tara:strand:- start:3163 stop:5031 length:1869 start_codon:yes stop_codon:yes gene_type:complete
MAAVVSSNPHRDHRFIQAGFPSVFSRLYEESGDPESWFHSGESGEHTIRTWRGEGDESVNDAWHQQKKDDANRSALTGVADTRRSIWRSLRHHQGLDLPKPELGSRKYANPSYGATSIIYSARPNQFAAVDELASLTLTGGVIRTATGQRWAHQRLQDRISQMDAMKTASFTPYTAPPRSATSIEGAIDVGEDEASGVKLHLDLAAALQALVEKIEFGLTSPSKVLLMDLYGFLKLLFRVGATATLSELNDIAASLQLALVQMRDTLLKAYSADPKLSKFRKSVFELLNRAKQYVDTMIVNVDKSAKERRLASANAVKALKFTSFGILALNTLTSETKALQEEIDLKIAEKAAFFANREAKRAADLYAAQKEEWERGLVDRATLLATEREARTRSREAAVAAEAERKAGRRARKAVRAARRAERLALEEAEAKMVAERDEEEAKAEGLADADEAAAEAARAFALSEIERKRVRDAKRRAEFAAQEAARLAAEAEEEDDSDLDIDDVDGKGRYSGRGYGRGGASTSLARPPPRVAIRVENQPRLREVRLIRDPRTVWAARQGAWYGDALPLPEGTILAPRTQTVKPPASLAVREVKAGMPTFDRGRPVEDSRKTGGNRFFRSH